MGQCMSVSNRLPPSTTSCETRAREYPSSARGSVVWALVVGILLTAGPAWPREFGLDLVIDSIEDLYELERSGELTSQQVDVLVALFQNPININRADRTLLYELPAMTYELADRLIAYRAEQGPFISMEQLRNVKGVTQEIAGSIEPFIEFGAPADAEPEAYLGPVQGRARVGSIWRAGLPIDRDPERINPIQERQAGPQSYIKAEGEGFTNFGAGLLATYRRQMFARWDRSRGQLVSSGPFNGPDLDGGYLYWEYAGWSMIAGTYTVGFGERLTFDNTAKRYPNGWYAFNRLRTDNETGRIRPQKHLLGTAVSLLGGDVPGGWIDATAFVSYQPRDIYQYDYWYGLDEYDRPNSCQTDGDCPDGYVCEQGLQICRSTDVISESRRTDTYRFETYSDAFREALVGANATFNFNERAHIGLTGYTSFIDKQLATPAQPNFSPAARWPRKDRFGAIGVNGRWSNRNLTLTGEWAYTGAGGKGHGALMRAVWTPERWMELSSTLRYYTPWFENPYSRGTAAADQANGLRQPDERGILMRAMVMPIEDLRLVSTVDLWQNPWKEAFEDGEQIWEPAPGPASSYTDLRLRQRVTYGVTYDEDAFIQLDYTNKDLRNNSRAETYELGDFEGLGERRKIRIGGRTTRVPGLRLTAYYFWAWEDTTRFDDRFDGEQRFRLRASYAPPWGGRLVGAFAWWADQVTFTQTIRQTRRNPAVDFYLQYRQTFLDRFFLRARYGMLYFREEDPDRYKWYTLAKLTFGAEF